MCDFIAYMCEVYNNSDLWKPVYTLLLHEYCLLGCEVV